MKIQQVAVQLFTIRDHLKTPADIATSLKKIRAIGYEAVQLSGLGPIDEKELLNMLDGEGLICCSTHEKTDMILDQPHAVVERLNKLNCKFTAVPSPGKTDLSSAVAIKDMIQKLNVAGKVLADAGQVLTYHNHQLEFRHSENRIILDLIYEQTDPRYLQAEIDTYWIQFGGGSILEWCQKLSGRLPLLHLKDMVINDQKQAVMTEIGNGNINWKPIIAAADKGGCQWFMVEHDTNWINNNPFESLKISFEYVRANLCS